MPKGSVMTVTFRLAGQKFIALNAGPHYKFTPAISFYVRCKTQKEVDGYWRKLSRGGSDEQCGWIKDKFGLSWQIIPDRLGALLASKDGAKAQRVMQAMLGMKKIEIAGLERAAKG
jgi:predicted 3-demethylubiquinone-9 3-methyltransferase (glyoxalase superfamily)